MRRNDASERTRKPHSAVPKPSNNAESKLMHAVVLKRNSAKRKKPRQHGVALKKSNDKERELKQHDNAPKRNAARERRLKLLDGVPKRNNVSEKKPTLHGVVRKRNAASEREPQPHSVVLKWKRLFALSVVKPTLAQQLCITANTADIGFMMSHTWGVVLSGRRSDFSV